MKVFVYFNLHKHVWSVKALQGENKGRVIAHLNELTLENATFKVSQAGRKRVLTEKRKNVHAGVVGELKIYDGLCDKPVSYNPYKYEYFYDRETLSPVYHASKVSMVANGRDVRFTK